MRKLLICIITYASCLLATEIDSFSLRDPNLKDSSEELNKLMNSYIQDTIKQANKWEQCDEKRFAALLHKKIGGYFWTEFENNISSSENIASLTISFDKSIYQDFSFFMAPALYIAELGPILHMGKYFIGSDKLGHFITEGYNYYKILKNNKTLDQALAFGEESERKHFGLQTTAVYSYADLVANYHGMFGFWLELMSERPKRATYVSCKNQRYYQRRLFDWADHINAGWDEAVNCNAYKNSELQDLAEARIKILEQERGIKLSCPIYPRECQKLNKFYGPFASRLISPLCKAH